jgi:hypothetical protein
MASLSRNLQPHGEGGKWDALPKLFLRVTTVVEKMIQGREIENDSGEKRRTSLNWIVGEGLLRDEI